jgi:hypothetical protein
LLRTPIGKEETLQEAGLVEMPGTQTFELGPVTAPAGGADTKPRGAWEIPRPGRPAVVGFIVIAALMMGMLGAINLLANWLAGSPG